MIFFPIYHQSKEENLVCSIPNIEMRLKLFSNIPQDISFNAFLLFSAVEFHFFRFFGSDNSCNDESFSLLSEKHRKISGPAKLFRSTHKSRWKKSFEKKSFFLAAAAGDATFPTPYSTDHLLVSVAEEIAD